MPHSSQLYRDEWAASSCRPLRLDFNDSSDSGSVVVEAAPSVLPGGCDQSPFYRVSVDISDHFGLGFLAMDVRVKIAVLPELPAIASQFARGDLLERLQKLRHQDQRRFIDQQVDMFRHQDVGIDPGLVTRAGLFENELKRFLGRRRLNIDILRSNDLTWK